MHAKLHVCGLMHAKLCDVTIPSMKKREYYVNTLIITKLFIIIDLSYCRVHVGLMMEVPAMPSATNVIFVAPTGNHSYIKY